MQQAELAGLTGLAGAGQGLPPQYCGRLLSTKNKNGPKCDSSRSKQPAVLPQGYCCVDLARDRTQQAGATALRLRFYPHCQYWIADHGLTLQIASFPRELRGPFSLVGARDRDTRVRQQGSRGYAASALQIGEAWVRHSIKIQNTGWTARSQRGKYYAATKVISLKSLTTNSASPLLSIK